MGSTQTPPNAHLSSSRYPPVGLIFNTHALAAPSAPPAGVPPAGVPSAGVPSARVPSAGVPSARVPSAGVPPAGHAPAPPRSHHHHHHPMTHPQQIPAVQQPTVYSHPEVNAPHSGSGIARIRTVIVSVLRCCVKLSSHVLPTSYQRFSTCVFYSTFCLQLPAAEPTEPRHQPTIIPNMNVFNGNLSA